MTLLRLAFAMIVCYLLTSSNELMAVESEHTVLNLPGDQDTSLQGTIARSCIPADSLTRYPVVLLHGFLGFDEILQVEYFYRVRRDYQNNCVKVFTPSVNPVTYIHKRAEELAPQIDRILARTKAEKVNIIAHSMGGLDARYLISSLGYGDRIASVTTIGTPHRGTPVPEMIWSILGKGDHVLYDAFEFLVAGVVTKGKHQPSELDLQAALWNLSPEFLNDYFNPANTNDERVYYQSYAGMSSVTALTTGDFLDPVLIPFNLAFLGWGKNDGLVSTSSAKWGNFRGILRSDHIDLIGQLFGTTSMLFDHRKLYKKILEDLARKGY
jgi:triacylglycerol lipase